MPNLDAAARSRWRSKWRAILPNDVARRQLVQSIEADVARRRTGRRNRRACRRRARKLAALLADVETPGTYRKVGPSLRYLAQQGRSSTWLYNWIREPKDFRPTTRMPQFFGLCEHLLPEPKVDATGKPVKDEHQHLVMEESKGRAEAEKFEPIEIRAISEYLLAASQPFEYVEQAGGRDGRAFRGARQEAVPASRLPGLPSAQGFPGGQGRRRARTCRGSAPS